MDSDQGKLFIGGISWETTEEKLKEYFVQYGDVLQTVVMRDKTTGRPRGFGFVVFSDPSVLDRVLQDKHVIEGRTVEAKRAMSREEQTNSRGTSMNTGRNAGNGGNIRTKKIFVGGLPPTLTEDGFRQYFENYGHVTDVVIMYDQHTQRPRGFGFISFDTEDAVDRVLHKTFHDLSGKQVEVKKALPKDASPGGSGRSMGGGAGGGAGSGGYQGYGASGGAGSYDGRMESNRYLQPQSTGGGFPPYGSSGYGAAGYGYGPANNGVGYGGYGGYGGASAGYGGPGGAAYGNPNVPNAGYASGPPGAPRSSWSNQAPSSYGAMGYGNAPSWGAPGAGAGAAAPGSGAAGQSPSGTTGYGSQGYGYGSYGVNDGSYGNQSGYGAVGGRSGPNSSAGSGSGELQGSGGGYMGSGYGDANGTSGYGNSSWRSDSQAAGNYGNQANGPHGGQVGYGSGYGGSQARQAQQQ